MRAHHRRVTVSVGLTAAVTAFAVVAAATAVSAAPRAASPVVVPTSARPAGTEQDALAAAAAADERVEVVALRSETTQVFAEPDGRLVAESAAVPQRVRRDDGEWEPVELALEEADDGTLRPQASVVDVRFSGGGDGPLVTLVREGKTFTLTWPTRLDPPSLEGDAARYREVLTGVDLIVRATDTGFAHVLEVKTPQAAASAEVRQVRYRVGGDATVTADPAGGVQAIAGGTLVASAPPATMWDSARPQPTGQRAPAAATEPLALPEPSTAVEPGSTATVAPVDTTVVDDHLVLRPDPALLAAPAAAFPIFVDPNWAAAKNKWAYATNNNTNNGDTSRARVGKDPEGSRTYRSFFNFPTAFLGGKHIESAYVQMELDHSASCDETPTHMFYSGAIASTPRTKWSPSLTTWVASALSQAPEGDGCDGKNDATVNFRNPKVTALLLDSAKKHRGNTTFGFCACNEKMESESATARWKKFFPDKAKLIVEYATYPEQPSALKIAGVACPASISDTVSIGAAQPTFTATYRDGDVASNQTLTATYEFEEIFPNNGTIARTPPGSRSVPAGSTATTANLTGLLDGKEYRIRTRATDPAPYYIESLWSAWCSFTVDTKVPVPTITVVTAPKLPGDLTRVTISSTDKDVVSFTYWWSGLPMTTVAATGSVKSVTVSLTAPRYGGLTLYAYATDVTRNRGPNAVATFRVGRPSEAIARWRLETYPGADLATALLDGKPAVGGNTPLAWDAEAPDTGWQADARLIGGSTASFDRTRGGAGGGAKATVPAFNTAKSFSVAAWARAADAGTAQTVVSKEGSVASVFQLQYRPVEKSWCMTMRARDAAGSAVFSACAPPAAFTVGRWTHLAGLYDDAESRVKLYVDGALAVNAVPPAAFRTEWAGGWNAGGPVVVGRASDTANSPRVINFFHGQIADVQLFDRALVDADLVGQRKGDPHSNGFDEPGIVAPIQVGRWDFQRAVGCRSPGETASCESPDATAWGRTLALTAGTEIGEGTRGKTLELDSSHFLPADDPLYVPETQEYGFSVPFAGSTQGTPVLRTDQPFTVSAWVRLDDTATTQTIISQDTAGAGYSGFDVVYRSDKRWVFGMRNGPAVADVKQRTSIGDLADDPTDWHHLVAVSDPGRKQTRLYVDGERIAAGPAHGGAPWQATGPLVVGRSQQPAGFTDWLGGSLDNVTAWQGVLTDTSIRLLFQTESATADPAK